MRTREHSPPGSIALKRLRIAVLTHEDLIPPPSFEGMDPKEKLAVRTEWDVYRSLRRCGHEVRYLGVDADLLPIRRLVDEWKPHIVFNMLMEFQDVGAFQAHIVSYLELLGIPYTGCNPRGILLSRDKALSKKIMRYHRIPTPAFAAYRPGRKVRMRSGLNFPVIVKSAEEEASMGIAQASVVRDEEQLRERVEFVHKRVGGNAIVEEYIEGRELTISVLGNERLQTFPVWEMRFDNLPDGSAPIATERAKWDPDYQKRVGIKTGAAKDLDDDDVRRIQRTARRLYRALDLSGYARIDLRMQPNGRIYVIEANATPDVKKSEDFAESAKTSGIEYGALLERILSLGLRYRPRGKGG